MNLIECTIKMKEETRAHYARLAEAVEEKEVRRIFTLLAAGEEEYLRMLTRMKARMKSLSAGGDGVDERVCVFRPRIELSNIREALKSDPDAYRHVTAEMKESIEFYDRMAEESSDESMKNLCRRLAHQERKHRNRIENIYSFVEDPQSYLEWGEFSNIRSI